ncbi:MAG: AMP-binding protein [Actinobacteria bacterium]|nr:AMP-binding protein [Actinomycetota bacterium]
MTEPTGHVDTFTRDRLPPRQQWPVLLRDKEPPRINACVELLDRTINRHGADRTAFIAADGTWTYGQLLDDVQRCAHVLRSAGVVSGSRVLLRAPNNGWLAIAWLATLRLGGVAVTTAPLLRAMELDPIVDISAPAVALVDHRFLDEWEKVAGFAGSTIVVGSGAADSLESRAHAAHPLVDVADTAADDIALLAFTSGTTGKPKSTMHEHQDILAIADTFSTHIVKPTSDDVFGGSPPLAFTFGLGGLVIFPMRIGASSVLLENGAPPHLLAAIDRERITCLFTAPTAYRAMLPMLTEHDVSSLRRCVSAGETLPESTWRAWFDATDVPLIDGIGATEMLHIFISAADEDIRPGSTGRVVPGYEAAVLDSDLVPMAPGTVGRLAVRGPTGCRYLADDRQTAYVQGGWNITGDLYSMDADGYFTYVSRADDLIVSSGYNIAAPEVENALLMHPAVAEVAVVGAPDADRGTVVKAFVRCTEGYAGSEALAVELQDHVKATIAPYKYPRLVEFVADLPKTVTGKLQRHRLKAVE